GRLDDRGAQGGRVATCSPVSRSVLGKAAGLWRLVGDVVGDRPRLLCPLGPAVMIDIGLMPPSGLGYGLLAARVGHDVGADLAPLAKTRHHSFSSASRSAKYFACSSLDGRGCAKALVYKSLFLWQ